MAYLFRAIRATANNTLVRPVAPRSAGKTAVAAKAAGVATGHQVIGREMEVNHAIRMYANLHKTKNEKQVSKLSA